MYGSLAKSFSSSLRFILKTFERGERGDGREGRVGRGERGGSGLCSKNLEKVLINNTSASIKMHTPAHPRIQDYIANTHTMACSRQTCN